METEEKVFTITTVDGKSSYIDGSAIDNIFNTIDGLRLVGKRWLKTYDYHGTLIHPRYVNIEQIVSIE